MIAHRQPGLVICIGLGILLMSMLACGAPAPAAKASNKSAVPRTVVVATRPPGARSLPTLVPTYTRMPTTTHTPTRLPTKTRTPTPSRTATPVPPSPPPAPAAGASQPSGGSGNPAPAATAAAGRASSRNKVTCPDPAQRQDIFNKIIFMTDREGPADDPNTRVYVMNPDGSDQKPMGPSEECELQTYAYWEADLARSNDGLWILTVERGGSGTSIYLRDNKGALVRRVTTLDQ